MNPRDAEGYLEFAYRMALAAGEAILPHFREIIDVEDKRNVMGYDPVTIADRAAEEVIRAEIMRAHPDHGIHGEEHGKHSGTSPLTWVIDPIDGTRSFILGQLHWATLIALHDGESSMRCKWTSPKPPNGSRTHRNRTPSSIHGRTWPRTRSGSGWRFSRSVRWAWCTATSAPARFTR